LVNQNQKPSKAHIYPNRPEPENHTAE